MRFIALQLLALCCVSCHANEPVHRRKAAAENAAAAHSAHSPPRYQWVDYGTAEPEGFHSTRRSATQRPAEFQVESNYKQIRIKVEFADSESDQTSTTPCANADTCTLGSTPADNYAYLKDTVVPAAITQLEKVMKVIRVKNKIYVGRTCTGIWDSVGSGDFGATSSAGVGKCMYRSDDSDAALKCGDYSVAAANMGGMDVYDGNGVRVAPGDGFGTDDSSVLSGSGGYDGYDYVLWVGAKACANARTLAYASPCSYDQYDRPVTGAFTYCPNQINTAASNYDTMLSTVVHEILHAFGFIEARFAYWYDHATGQPRTTRDTVGADALYPTGKPNLGMISPYLKTTIDWTLGFSGATPAIKAAARAKTIYAATNAPNEVLFKWTGTHNIYLLPDVTAFDACDFSSATLLGSTTPYIHTVSSTGMLYFACSVGSHCTSGQKLALTVVAETGLIMNPGTSVYASFTERGQTVWKITTPQVLTTAKEHFGCTTLNGVGMENEGGGGTAGSHWEQRTMLYDVMGGTSIAGPVWTKMTLGFLYDTGYYMVEWSMAGTMRWGLNAGCNFFMDKCLTPGTTPAIVSGGENYFCNDVLQAGCTANSLGMGECGIYDGNTDIPSYMQYWTDDATKGGGLGAYGVGSDFCPYIPATKDCRFTTQSGDTSGKFGETASATSRCFASTLTKSGSQETNPYGASCLQYECTATELRIYILNPTGSSNAGGWVSCPTSGGDVDPPDQNVFESGNKITCPVYSTFCPEWVYFAAPAGVTQSTHAAWAATGGTGSAEYNVFNGGPTNAPTVAASAAPSSMPSSAPSSMPSSAPSSMPSSAPSSMPSSSPSDVPSAAPSDMPSSSPSSMPSSGPSVSSEPSGMLSSAPSDVPSAAPSDVPSSSPSDVPSAAPSSMPSSAPSDMPSSSPSDMPSSAPSDMPSSLPSSMPSKSPSDVTSSSPSDMPSSSPSNAPTAATEVTYLLNTVSYTVVLAGVSASNWDSTAESNFKSEVASSAGLVCGSFANATCTAADVVITTTARRNLEVNFYINVYSSAAATSAVTTLSAHIASSAFATALAATGGGLASVTSASVSSSTITTSSTSSSDYTVVIAVCVSIGVALIIAVAVVLYCCCRSEPTIEDKPTGTATAVSTEDKPAGTATAVSTTGVAMEQYPKNGMTTLDVEQQTTETRFVTIADEQL